MVCGECRHFELLPGGEARDERTLTVLEPPKKWSLLLSQREFVAPAGLESSSPAHRRSLGIGHCDSGFSVVVTGCRRALRLDYLFNLQLLRKLFDKYMPDRSVFLLLAGKMASTMMPEMGTGARDQCAVGFIREKLELTGYLVEAFTALI